MAKPGAEECSEEGGGMSAFGFLSFVLAVVNGKLDRKPHRQSSLQYLVNLMFEIFYLT